MNVWLRQRQLLDVDGDGRITRAAARFVANLGAGFLYVLEGDRERIAADLAREIAKLEGVAAVWTADQYATLGIPTTADNPLVGDVAFEATPGYCFGDTANGDALVGVPKYVGTHGQRPDHGDNLAFCLAAAPGISRGISLGAITSRDVAPTLAHILGVRMINVEGRRLDEILA